MGDQDTIDALLNALHDPDWTVRWGAVYGASQLADARAVPGLTESLSDAEMNVRLGCRLRPRSASGPRGGASFDRGAE